MHHPLPQAHLLDSCGKEKQPFGVLQGLYWDRIAPSDGFLCHYWTGRWPPQGKWFFSINSGITGWCTPSTVGWMHPPANPSSLLLPLSVCTAKDGCIPFTKWLLPLSFDGFLLWKGGTAITDHFIFSPQPIPKLGRIVIKMLNLLLWNCLDVLLQLVHMFL